MPSGRARIETSDRSAESGRDAVELNRHSAYRAAPAMSPRPSACRCPRRQDFVAHSWAKRRLDDWLNRAERAPCRGEQRLQMRLFRAVRRRASWCPIRPVTPEVAGSSPITPVKVPANRAIVLSSSWIGHRLHRLFSKRRRNRQKRPEMRSRGDDFKPIQAEFRLTAKAACDYTKWPEVKGPRPASNGRKSSLSLRRGGRCSAASSIASLKSHARRCALEPTDSADLPERLWPEPNVAQISGWWLPDRWPSLDPPGGGEPPTAPPFAEVRRRLAACERLSSEQGSAVSRRRSRSSRLAWSRS
jgi:hypothetical protein